MSAPSGDQVAGATVTPVQLDDVRRRGAGLLRTLGEGWSAGDRVAVLGNVGVDALAVVLALRDRGVCLVPLDSSFSLEETAYAVNESRAATVLADAGSAALLEQLRPLTPYVTDWRVIDGTRVPDAALGAPKPLPPSGSLHYSATSTGRPVAYSAPDARDAQGRREVAALLGGHPIGASSSLLIATSLSDPAALLLAEAAYDAGATVVLCDGLDATAVLAALEQTRPTMVHLSPPVVLGLARLYDGGRAVRWVPGVAVVSVPGCASSATRGLIEAWGPVLRLVYVGPGVGAIAAIEGVDVLLHPGSMGAPLADPAAPHLRIAAEDPTGAGLIEVEHPTGSGTWVSWGDRGWMSKGRLTVLDQFHAGADARGRAPQLVEAALVAHPSVADAAVVTRHGTSAMISRAYVQPAPGAELRGLDEVLIAALREQVPEPWVPAQIAIVPLVPRTATGKLDRRRLLAHEPGSDLG